MAANRKECEVILRLIAPAMRDILWCALVWNDHNFDHQALLNKAISAAKALGMDRGLGRGVDQANTLFERIDAALGNITKAREAYEARFINYMVGILTLDGTTDISREEAISMARNELDNLDEEDRSYPEEDAAECMSYWDCDESDGDSHG